MSEKHNAPIPLVITTLSEITHYFHVGYSVAWKIASAFTGGPGHDGHAEPSLHQPRYSQTRAQDIPGCAAAPYEIFANDRLDRFRPVRTFGPAASEPGTRQLRGHSTAKSC